MKALKILLVEDDPGDLCLLRELIAELEFLPYWRLLKRSTELIAVDIVADAIDVVRHEPLDAILFSLAPAGGRTFADFLSLYAEAPDIPCVVIADRIDETLALAAVREGAHDYVLKADVDSASLARSLRFAIEKQRIVLALRSLSPADDLTGLYHKGAFLTLAEHDLQIIAGLKTQATLLVARFEGIADVPSRENRELLLLDLAETLRDKLPEATLAGRTGIYDFAFLTFDGCGPNSAEQMLQAGLEEWKCASAQAVTARITAVRAESASAEHLLACAESRLCETKAYPALEPQ